MKVSNMWGFKGRRDPNRFQFKLRIGIVTVLDLYYDHSDKDFNLIILNFKLTI